jgi:hypothetical protein
VQAQSLAKAMRTDIISTFFSIGAKIGVQMNGLLPLPPDAFRKAELLVKLKHINPVWMSPFEKVIDFQWAKRETSRTGTVCLTTIYRAGPFPQLLNAEVVIQPFVACAPITPSL